MCSQMKATHTKIDQKPFSCLFIFFATALSLSFYVPFDGFGMNCTHCFWRVHYSIIFLISLVSIVYAFKSKSLWFYKNMAAIIIFNFYYAGSLLWSNTNYAIELFAVMLLSLVIFVVFYWLFL